MKKSIFFYPVFLLFILLSGEAKSQCSTPQILGVNNGPNTVQISYQYQQSGSYFLEYGAPGFTPGTDANPGIGGTVLQLNSPYGVETTGIPYGTNKTYYLRLRCPDLSWTPNSTPHTFNSAGASNYSIIYPIFNLNASVWYIANDPNMIQINAVTVCGTFSSGNETRYRYDSKGTSYYELVLSNSLSYPNPSFAYKELNGNNQVQNYTCVQSYKSTNTGGVLRDYYRFGPLQEGVAYDFLFDPIPVPWVYQVVATLSCPLPTSITTSNIQPNSININKNCTTCSDSLILEYGLKGFTPGTGVNPGTNGTISYFSGQNMALSGLCQKF